MAEIKNQEVVLTSINTDQKSKQLTTKKEIPKWLGSELFDNYKKTDLTFEYCLDLFARIEAAKREKFPPETMRIWFTEFIRRGWTKKILLKRYQALLSTKIFGIEKLDFADWVNAVEVMAMDEVNKMVDDRINSKIQRGNYLRNANIELTPEEKRLVDLSVSKQIELQYQNRRYELMEQAAEELKKAYLESLKGKKRILAELSMIKKIEITNKLFSTGKVEGNPEGFLFQATLHNLEDFADLVDDNWLI
jgi:hypothetical protein